jgi:hypothetical protein
MQMTILGLTPQQHAGLGKLLYQSGIVTRLEDATKGGNQYLPPVRVIALTDRVYDSTASELLPVFVYDSTRTVFNVQQSGSSLSGYLVLKINGVPYVVECRRQNFDDLNIAGLRITVLPGMWELDFGILTESKAAATTVEVVSLTTEQQLSLCELFDDETTPIFLGSMLVRREFWVTVPGPEFSDTLPVQHQEVTDCLPYLTGNVGRGAIGTCVWNWDAGYTAIAWMCRTFSHANGYVQADDPVSIDSLQ